MEKKTAKPTLGTWDKLTTSNEERLPKVSFEINVPETVTFLDENPRESISEDGGAYYTFDVNYKGNDTVIQTSAWTLLIELKKLAPLKGKTITITKKIDKGKQYFHVISQT